MVSYLRHRPAVSRAARTTIHLLKNFVHTGEACSCSMGQVISWCRLQKHTRYQVVVVVVVLTLTL